MKISDDQKGRPTTPQDDVTVRGDLRPDLLHLVARILELLESIDAHFKAEGPP